MTITISSGTIDVGGGVSAGNPVVVLSGGAYELGTISSGGLVTASSGAIVAYLTVSSGGVLQGGGTLSGLAEVFGSVSGLNVGADAEVTVLSGGSATALTVSGGGGGIQDIIQVGSGGHISGTNLVDGTEVVSFGGTASGDIIQSGSFLFDDGASVSDETILSGGYLALGGDIKTSLDVASSGVAATQTISGVTVLSGGGVELLAATVESGVTVSFGSGAATIGLTVVKGGTILGAAQAEGVIDIAGVVSGAEFESATATLSSGGTTTGVMVGSAATMRINLGGVASATTIGSGGEALDLGTIRNTSITAGGIDVVRSGGLASATTIQSGGKQVVSSGGVAFGATVSSGGFEEALASGKTSGTVVSSGGREIVSSGGLAEQISLLAGGVLTDLGAVRISGGGTLAGSISGGGQITEIGAGDLILSGSDAGFSGAAVISGGMIELAGSHALGTGFVQYVEPSTGSAVLQVDANDQPKEGATYGTTLSNFSGLKEALDLQSVVYRSDAVASVTGSTLTVTEGTRTYTFTLAGSIASAYHVVSDSEGGTEIAPGATASVIAFTQAAASFAPAGAAKTALVSSTAPTAASPFLHATASGGAGHV